MESLFRVSLMLGALAADFVFRASTWRILLRVAYGQDAAAARPSTELLAATDQGVGEPVRSAR